MSNHSDTYRRFAGVVDHIENETPIDVLETNIEYVADDGGGSIFSAMNELMGSTKHPVFELALDVNTEKYDVAFDRVAALVEALEDELEVDVDRATSGTYDVEGGLFWPDQTKLSFGLKVDTRPLADADAELCAICGENETPDDFPACDECSADEDSESIDSTRITFDDEGEP